MVTFHLKHYFKKKNKSNNIILQLSDFSLYFQTNGETAHASHFVKPSEISKVVDNIINRWLFDQNLVILKWVLDYKQLKQNMVTIEADQVFTSSTLYIQMILENIKKYKTMKLFVTKRIFLNI